MTRFVCSNSAGLYVCNSDGQIEGIARIPDAFAGTFFGLSWTPDGKELILGHDPGQPDVGAVDEIDMLKRETGRLSIGDQYVALKLASPHQLTATPDGRVLIANTGRNALTVWQPNGTFRHVWLDGREWDRYSAVGEEGSHFNSVFWRDDRIWILAHNHSRGSYALEVEDGTFEVIQRIDTAYRGCHNLWVTGDDVFTLASFTGELGSMKTGEVVWSSGDGTSLVRGLAVGKDHILIGDTDRASRIDRNLAGGGVYIVDRSTMRTIDFIDFGNNGGTSEVRLLGEADECHNLPPFSGEISIDWTFTRKQAQTRREAKLMRHAQRLDPATWSLLEGSPMSEGGDITIEPDYFALATMKRECDNGEVTAEICFEPTPKIQQVALVSRHNGPRDTRMYVALLEYFDRYVMLKWLLNDGDTWHTLFAQHQGSDLQYGIRYQFEGPRHRVWINDSLCMDLQNSWLLGGSFGIRMRSGRLRALNVISKRAQAARI
jgi:hypothetical protein